MRVDNEGNPFKKNPDISPKKSSLDDFIAYKVALKKEAYFDNSTLNNLWEEQEPIKSMLIERFLSHYYLRLSSINLTEIAANPDEEKRNEMLRMALSLSQGRAPLNDPIEFLKDVLGNYQFAAHLSHPSQPTAVFGVKDILVWLNFLKSPALFDESYRSLAKKDVRNARSWDNNLSTGRQHIQAVVQKLSVKDKKMLLRSERHFIRRFIQERKSYLHLIEYFIKEDSTISHLIGHEMEILHSLDAWAVLTCAYSLMIYNLLYKQEKYSLKNSPGENPGSNDILQAVYLPEIDIFVTDDKGQRRLFRIAKLFISKRTEVISYSEFRRRLLV